MGLLDEEAIGKIDGLLNPDIPPVEIFSPQE
jgi:hypothetical protein